jgi:hypothetical protein
VNVILHNKTSVEHRKTVQAVPPRSNSWRIPRVLNDFSNMTRPVTGLEAFGGNPNPKSNFPAVRPSTMGSQLTTTENHKQKVKSL